MVSQDTFCELPEAYSKVLKVKDLLADMPEKNFSLQELADMVGLCMAFLRQFKNMGLPPHAWLVQARLQKARQLLKQDVQIVMVAQQWFF